MARRQLVSKLLPTEELDARAVQNVVYQARRAGSEVQLTKCLVRGAMEVAEDIMIETVELERTRRMLARGDDLLYMGLGETAALAAQTARRLQRGLYDNLDLD